MTNENMVRVWKKKKKKENMEGVIFYLRSSSTVYTEILVLKLWSQESIEESRSKCSHSLHGIPDKVFVVNVIPQTLNFPISQYVKLLLNKDKICT